MNFSKKTTVGEVLNDEKAKAVLVKHFGEGVLFHPMLSVAKPMSLEKVTQLSNGEISQRKLEAVVADLEAL